MKKESNMKKRMTKVAALFGAAGILALGGTVAYLTDYDTTVNEFTVGKVDIKLEEPSWTPDEHVDLEPSEEVKKDPQIKNTGVNDSFVYMEVSIPTADVITADKDGNRIDKKVNELFTYTKSSDWTQIESKMLNGNKVYTYCYNHILEPGATTTPLFDTITFANIVEGQLDTREFDVPVRAYAIQTVNTGGDSGTIIQQATTAYRKYVNQNLGLDSAVLS